MKKIILLSLAVSTLLLTGCETPVPVTMKFPNVPEELLVACPDLKDVQPGTTKLSEVIGVVSENYSQYHACRLQVDNWIEWYNTQKKIFDDVK